MTFVESQPLACSDRECSANLVRFVPAETGGTGGRSNGGGCVEVFFGPSRTVHVVGWCSKGAKKRVCTMCTPGASDSVVPASDRAVLRMFLGEWRFFMGRRPVRVPPRARVFPVQGPFSLRVCTFCSLVGPCGGLFYWWPVVWPGASSVPCSVVLVLLTCSWAQLAGAT
jgi:hypothetical protein